MAALGGRGSARVTGCRRGGSGVTPLGSAGVIRACPGQRRCREGHGEVGAGRAVCSWARPVFLPAYLLPTLQQLCSWGDGGPGQCGPPFRRSMPTETPAGTPTALTLSPQAMGVSPQQPVLGSPPPGGTSGLAIGPGPAPQEQAGVRAGPPLLCFPPTLLQSAGSIGRGPRRDLSLSGPCQHWPNLLKEGPQSKRGVLAAGVLPHRLAVSPSPRLRRLPFPPTAPVSSPQGLSNRSGQGPAPGSHPHEEGASGRPGLRVEAGLALTPAAASLES